MTFVEDWYSAADCAALAALAARAPSGAVIEVGCWEGKSTVALAEAVAPREVHAVDTWAGSPGEISADLAAARDVYPTFVANTAGLAVVAHRMTWAEFFAAWDGPIGLIHIDAEHTYDQVAGNIRAALPHMADGGIVCGDDAHHPPVIAAAHDTLSGVTIAPGTKVWSKECRCRT